SLPLSERQEVQALLRETLGGKLPLSTVYKIIGADGKEYGPMDVGVLQQWLAEGRINAQTQAKETSGTEWKTIAEIPELKAALFATAAPSPPPLTTPPIPPGQRTGQETGLAVVSLVLGILSLV